MRAELSRRYKNSVYKVVEKSVKIEGFYPKKGPKSELGDV